MNSQLPGTSDPQLEHWVTALDSIMDGELAMDMLVASGDRAVPYLEHFLLAGSPRTIALPRCRATLALGELGAYSTLISYFREYEFPRDAEVLFAEDAVRSAVARELLRWKSDEVLQVLMDAAKQRATGGLVLAIGEFHRTEAISLLFQILEDDFCREEAKDGLRKVREATHQYAILLIRGLSETPFYGPSALHRRRATLQLLDEFGVASSEWRDLQQFLAESDADVVISAARIGSQLANLADRRRIVEALFRISEHVNWAQEGEIDALLDTHSDLACEIAHSSVEERRTRGERANWLAPSWRILRHVLGRELEGGHYGAA
jgi:hypothetical protein